MKKIVVICLLLLLNTMVQSMKLSKPQGITKTNIKLRRAAQREREHTQQILHSLNIALYHTACARDAIQQSTNSSHNFIDSISLTHQDNAQVLSMINRIQYQETALHRDRNLLLKLQENIAQNIIDTFFDMVFDSHEKNEHRIIADEPETEKVVLPTRIRNTKKYPTETKTTSKKLKILRESQSVNVED